MLIVNSKKYYGFALVLALGMVLLTGCYDEDVTSSSGSSSTSSTSSGGTVLSFGGTSYTYTCPITSGATVTIPPTSTSACASVYKDYARVFGCNLIDDFASAQASYESCVAQDIAACATASSSDPNC